MYVHGREERLIQAARGDKIDGLEAASVLKRSKKEKRLEDWKEKVLHGQYLTLRSKKWSVLGLAEEWRFEKRMRKLYCGGSEQLEY